jgi:uncharacterized lipoprotein YddW (UPF0748 family)
VVSAAVVPDQAQALYHRYQAWPSWVAQGIVDAVAPMTYTTDTRLYRAQIAEAQAKLGKAAPIWPGIGAWRMTLGEIADKVRAAREMGAAGFVVFSHESLVPEDADGLRDAFADRGGRGAGAGAGMAIGAGPRR